MTLHGLGFIDLSPILVSSIKLIELKSTDLPSENAMPEESKMIHEIELLEARGSTGEATCAGV
jgi:hypothetical protein